MTTFLIHPPHLPPPHTYTHIDTYLYLSLFQELLSHLGTSLYGKMTKEKKLVQLGFGSWKAQWLAVSVIREQEFYTDWKYKQK